MSGQSGGQRLPLSKLNDQLTCRLCGGYFIDATTIIECLHSFCRSCIVKYLENNKYCPICEVQVHKSKPLLNIRPDHTLQDIVYKLVPGCYQNEMRCRREFYSKHPESCTQATSLEAKGEPTESHIYSPDESLSLSLEYFNPLKDAKGIPIKPLLRRYLRCPAAVTIFHLQKLIRAKYGLTDAHRVDVLYKEEPLCSNYTLMDVMYIYHWRRKVPLHLSYRIFESSPKRIKLSDDNVNYKTSLLDAGIDSIESNEETSTKREWKEVQLKISETGIMSITDISDQQFKKTARADEPVASVETINTLIIEENVNKNNISDTTKENEKSVSKQNIGDPDVPAKLNELDDKRNCNQTEVAKASTQETESTINSKYEKEFKNRSDNNNVDDKTVLQKCLGPEEVAQPTNDSEIRNNNVKNKDQKESSKNNNNIIIENKVETTKQNSKNEVKFVNTGSKINALSVKLQFQPKTGQLSSNNASSKKAAKERKLMPQSSKKVDIKVIENSKSAEPKSFADTSKVQGIKNNCGAAVNKSIVPYSAEAISQKSASESQDIAESSSSTSPNSTVSSELKQAETNVKNVQSSKENVSSVQEENLSEKKRCTSDVTSIESSQRSNGQGSTVSQKPLYTQSEPLSNENLVSLNFSTSMPVSVGNGIKSTCTSIMSHPTSTFPYTVHDLVNSTMLKNSLKNLTTSATQKLSATMVSGSEIPTSSISESAPVFSMPSTAPSKSNYSNPGISISKESTLKSNNLEVSSTYSVPPCPDAIPISLMKPSVRKNELLTKGSNLNEICAKIGTFGSKINDICAKIGENSKEKNKTEGRSKSDIPDLLKIGRKNGSPSITIDSANKQQQHVSISNVPIYAANSNTVATENKNVYSYAKDAIRPTSLVTSSSVTTSHPVQKVPSASKKQSQAVSYKTLRDPPRSWNPTLSKNNYVAVKNQSKETQSQLHQNTLFERGKTIQSKPAKIFKMRNMPRYLGNPASGVKPMYGIGNECKEKEQSTITSTTPTNTSSSSKNGNLSMMKIDPKTLSPIVSTVNSAIVSPPPYSPSARNYPNPPFSRDICRNVGTPIYVSPKNSPVNMLSTSPFIPSPTPNMNPRLIYPHFPSPFPDAGRFPNPLIRPPIGIPSPSAFHSSLPPSINKLYQRSSYIPQTTGFSPVSQPPTVQRIPPSTYSSPKSPKTTSLTAISSTSYGLVNPETQTVATTSLENNNLLLPENTSQDDVSAFNLSKTASFSATENAKVSSETVRNVKTTSLSPTSTAGQSKSTLNVTSKLKQESSPRSTADADQSKEQPDKEAARCKEQNLYTSKGQNLEKNRSDNSDNVNRKEKLATQVNGDLTSKNKEEKPASKLTEQQQREETETKITQVIEKIVEKNDLEESKNEDCEKTEGQKNKSETQSNRTDT